MKYTLFALTAATVACLLGNDAGLFVLGGALVLYGIGAS